MRLKDLRVSSYHLPHGKLEKLKSRGWHYQNIWPKEKREYWHQGYIGTMFRCVIIYHFNSSSWSTVLKWMRPFWLQKDEVRTQWYVHNISYDFSMINAPDSLNFMTWMDFPVLNYDIYFQVVLVRVTIDNRIC